VFRRRILAATKLVASGAIPVAFEDHPLENGDISARLETEADERGDSRPLWSRSVKQPRLDPARGSRTAARRKPRIEINFRESVRRTRPPARPRLSVLFAESLSLREIQSRARPRAPPRPLLFPPHSPESSPSPHARVCALLYARASHDRTRDRGGWPARPRCTRAIDPRFCAVCQLVTGR